MNSYWVAKYNSKAQRWTNYGAWLLDLRQRSDQKTDDVNNNVSCKQKQISETLHIYCVLKQKAHFF